MRISKQIRVRSAAECLAAASLALALCLTGPAFGSSRTSSQKKHSSEAHHRTASRTGTSSHASSLHHVSLKSSKHRRRSSRRRHAVVGQRTMDSARAMEIQQALIQAHYLNGSPTGQWDSETQAAMVKYQTDNGWQSKITPDSRALIKLGLGPKQDAGEYSATPTASSGISKVPSTTQTDTIRTMATAEIPTTPSN